MLDVEDAVSRAKDGPLSRAELEQVVSLLHARAANGGDSYRLLYIVGRAGNPGQHEELVRGFLNAPEDPMLSRLAVQILGTYWGLAGKYRDAIESFISGVEWDEDEDVRLAAIGVAGEYLLGNRDCGILSKVVGLAENTSERQLIRRAALDALAIATGEATSGTLPSPLSDVDMDGSWAREIMRNARRRQDC